MIRYNEDTSALAIIAKDTGDFAINTINYILNQGDTVYFTVNTELENPDFKIQKVITDFTDGKAIVRLSSSDTDIPVGEYYYDVEVHTADGRVDTIQGPSKFKVLGGVTY